MKPVPHTTTAAALALMSALFCLLSSNGCTSKRPVALRYTPLVQTYRLADRTNPPTVVVGQFTIARPGAALAERHPSLFRTPLLDVLLSHQEYEPAGDVSSLVRDAFVDALVKAGFKVPTLDESAPTFLFQLTGRVVAFDVGTSGVLAKTWLAANIGVELTIAPQTGTPICLSVQGQSKREGYEPALEHAIADSLDSALQECVQKFLASPELLQISGKGRTDTSRQATQP